MRVLNIPPTSYLLPLTSKSLLLPPASYLLRDAPCEAMRRPERRDARWRATRRARPSGPLSIVHCPLSIIHYPLSIISCFLTLQSYNTGEAKSSIWAKRCRAAPRFLPRRRCSALIVNRLVANGFRPLLFALRS